jgi:hypothetical protein
VRGDVARQRHPRAGTGSGSWGRYHGHHGGYYGPHHGGYYRPYYGHYYRPYYYGSLYVGWPYYSAWPYYSTWPYYGGWYDTGGYYTSSYTYAPSYYSSGDAPAPYPPEDRSEDLAAAPARDYGRVSVARGDTGQLRLEVRPEDTSVYVDDEFRGTAREARILNLPPGRHTVELVRPGYAIEHRVVEVVKGERADLLVELRRP